MNNRGNRWTPRGRGTQDGAWRVPSTGVSVPVKVWCTLFLLSGQTKKIILMMPEPQMTPQIIMIPRQIAKWKLQIHPHRGEEDTTKDVLVSLMLPIRGTVHWFYMNCTWLGRVLHTAWLPGRGLPFTLTPTHDFHHHILMLQQTFPSYSLNHVHSVIQFESPLLEKIFSWSPDIWGNIWA